MDKNIKHTLTWKDDLYLSFNILLPGDRQIVIVAPRYLSQTEFDYFLRMIDLNKPGLVIDPPTFEIETEEE